MARSNFIPEHTLETDGAANVLHAGGILREHPIRLPFGFGTEDLMILLHDLVYILATVALVFTFFVRVITVDGSSMEPTLRQEDKLVLMSSLWYQEPERGDIVVARIPEFSPDPIVKRIIAVEGDVVDIDFEAGTVSVNGAVLEEAYVSEPTHLHFSERGIVFPVEIGENCVFLMGDNRNHSYDSRFGAIGQVDQRNIVGKVICLMLPGTDEQTGSRDFERIGKIR